VALVKPDSLATVDVNPNSPHYGKVVGTLAMPGAGDDELHHFGWNACSSALCPMAPHPHMERRYLVVPGLRSSRIYIVDTKPNPRAPQIVKVLQPEDVMRRTGYSRPHTVHCGPSGIYVSALAAAGSDDGPGGIFVMDHQTFEPLGRFELDRGSQFLAYDFWWHIGHDVVVTSEWGIPRHFEAGLDANALMQGQFGHKLHFFDVRTRRHMQEVDLGAEYQMALELRPAHDPTKLYGFVGVVTSLANLASSIWVWYRENGQFKVKKVIEIPAQAAEASLLPPILQGFAAVPPLVTDINLSLDDRFLYVSCWGTGELHQYDVSDPFSPKLTGVVPMGGIVQKTPHPSGQPIAGGPQMVEVSRDGRRVYLTNSLYSAWDDQFYPAGIPGCMVKLDVGAQGGLTLDPKFCVTFEGARAHQVRLQGGDSSTDSFCFA
ncbi:MAG TPA: selenium-binding protein SBP56-related protein, partial [Symbiobacteriaceae bacterium]|nr:selenium-binding protein SBP56-related protein [Symbiobacteriaceae bacterium]